MLVPGGKQPLHWGWLVGSRPVPDAVPHPASLLGTQTARWLALPRSFARVKALPGPSSACVVSMGSLPPKVCEVSVASPDSDRSPWVSLCIPELSGLDRAASHCAFLLATTAGHSAHRDR